MPEFNLELFKTSILNFAYNHSKHRKKVYPLSEKPIYLSKINSSPNRQLLSFSFLSHVTIIKR